MDIVAFYAEASQGLWFNIWAPRTHRMPMETPTLPSATCSQDFGVTLQALRSNMMMVAEFKKPGELTLRSSNISQHVLVFEFRRSERPS